VAVHQADLEREMATRTASKSSGSGSGSSSADVEYGYVYSFVCSIPLVFALSVPVSTLSIGRDGKTINAFKIGLC
jgi:hypothetical protein